MTMSILFWPKRTSVAVEEKTATTTTKKLNVAGKRKSEIKIAFNDYDLVLCIRKQFTSGLKGEREILFWKWHSVELHAIFIHN